MEGVRPGISMRALAAFAIVLAGLAAVAWAADRKAQLMRIGAMPLDEEAVTPNHMLRVHYSRDFWIRVTQTFGGTDVVTLVRPTGFGGVALFAIPNAVSATSAQLDQTYAADPRLEEWAPMGMVFGATIPTAERCREGDDAVTRVRIAEVSDQRWRVWSCTFVRNGRGYRFVTYAPEHAEQTMAVLRRLALATDVL